MKSNKYKRLIAMIIFYLILLAFPIFSEIYYETLYYWMAVLIIPISIYRIVYEEKFEKKFYKRWHKARKQGFWINIFREGSRSLLWIIVVVSVSQFFGNGRTPFEIVSILSGGALLLIVLLILGFSLVGGIVAWFENDKRYKRIHYSIKYSKKTIYN